MANQLPKGPQGPRRYPGQNEAAQKQRELMQGVKKDDLAKQSREAYERFMKSPEADTIGMKRGGKIKKMAGGGEAPGRKSKGSGSMQPLPNPRYGKTPQEPYNEKALGYSGVSKDPVIPGPFEYPSYIEEVGEERVSGPRMRKGGMARSSASKRADGCAIKGKTRGKFV